MGNKVAGGSQRVLGTLWLFALFVLAASAPLAASAATGSKLSFDPVLSLTGGCTVSTLDPEPDPSCSAGPLPPSGSFAQPSDVATDSYGNIYVASFGQADDGSEGRIDIFDSSGRFISELLDSDGPRQLAVDSTGTLYVMNGTDANVSGRRLVRYVPSIYHPEEQKIVYGNPPGVITATWLTPFMGIAINAANDHLFVNYTTQVVEYGSAAEGNTEVEAFDAGYSSSTYHPVGMALAIDATRGRLYVNAVREEKGSKGETIYIPVVQVYELAAPHHLIEEIDGSSTPAGKFYEVVYSLGVDEGNGHIYVYDFQISKLYELTEDGGYVGTIEHGFQPFYAPSIGVDNGQHSPNGALSAQGRYVFVPSDPTGVGHAYAFGPLGAGCEPEIASATFAEVAETEAELRASINPCNLVTHYTFEYTPSGQFEIEGFNGAKIAGSGQLPASNVEQDSSVAATGLVPGTSYDFRIIATNEAGAAEAEGSFSTYPAESLSTDCSNGGLRSGLSALLPDCRAYELVTPPNTNSRAPLGLSKLGTFFTTQEASPEGDKVSFRIEGGAIPGVGGTGSINGDPYLATRGPSGWSTAYVGPTPLEAPTIATGSHSPDQGYSFWDNPSRSGEGSSSIEDEPTSYVRYPDGRSELVGRGSLGVDPQATGRLISAGGNHIIFTTSTFGTLHGTHLAVQLEPNAPQGGTGAVYDRTSDEVTHVVSLLTANETPEPGEDAGLVGASRDGRGIAFEIGSKLYLRYENTQTYEIDENVTFEGVAEGGARLFYLKEGSLFRFDVQTDEVLPFTSGGNITPVNISKDGSTAYFISRADLVNAPNPQGEKAVSGEANLYLSREGAISFVGTVTERDVEGDAIDGDRYDGLGLWTLAIGPSLGTPGRLGVDPSRTTADGNVLLFESRADLTGYDPEGHSEIYRFDAAAERLMCLSCNPTGAAGAGDATLETMTQNEGKEVRSPYILVNNLRPDGRRAFFQSKDALVPADVDQRQDIYEWEDDGIGSCTHAGGCVYLISWGHSQQDDSLHAVSESGDDVFFVSSDLLLGADADETPSIYDARVGGGFPEPLVARCEGEGCRGPLAITPPMAMPSTSEAANVRVTRHHCRKGTHRVKRKGRTRCVRKHRRHHRHVRQGR